MSLNQIQDKVFATINQFDKELERFPTLSHIEKQIGVPKVYTSAGALAVYFLLIFVNIGGIGQLLANFATLIVPGYFSLIALETRTTDDDTHYLTYWVVYAAFSVIEFWSKAILYWIPFYWVFKTILFLYLGLPGFNGSRLVYEHVLRPFSVNVLGVHGGGSSASLKEHVGSVVDSGSASIATGVKLH